MNPTVAMTLEGDRLRRQAQATAAERASAQVLNLRSNTERDALLRELLARVAALERAMRGEG